LLATFFLDFFRLVPRNEHIRKPMCIEGKLLHLKEQHTSTQKSNPLPAKFISDVSKDQAKFNENRNETNMHLTGRSQDKKILECPQSELLCSDQTPRKMIPQIFASKPSAVGQKSDDHTMKVACPEANPLVLQVFAERQYCSQPSARFAALLSPPTPLSRTNSAPNARSLSEGQIDYGSVKQRWREFQIEQQRKALEMNSGWRSIWSSWRRVKSPVKQRRSSEGGVSVGCWMF
jgi:hypothetical protein